MKQIVRMPRLFGLAKLDNIVAQVVNTVPLAQEGVAQDGQRACRSREVHAHEGADAGALHLQDVIVGGDAEVVTSQVEGEVRQTVPLRAVNRVLPGPALLSTNFTVPIGKSVSGTKLDGEFTHKSSARSEGRAIRDVPVSSAAPVFSSSATSSPKAMELS